MLGRGPVSVAMALAFACLWLNGQPYKPIGLPSHHNLHLINFCIDG